MKTARQVSDVGALIHYFRTQQKLSQKELADKSDLTQAAISKLEQGGNCALDTLLTILKALRVELAFQEIERMDTSDLSSLRQRD